MQTFCERKKTMAPLKDFGQNILSNGCSPMLFIRGTISGKTLSPNHGKACIAFITPIAFIKSVTVKNLNPWTFAKKTLKFCWFLVEDVNISTQKFYNFKTKSIDVFSYTPNPLKKHVRTKPF